MHKYNKQGDYLERVYEMNGLFLSFLCHQAKARRDCLGLPLESVELMAAASQSVLDQAAALPQALFALNPGDHRAAESLSVSNSAERHGLQSLQQAILLSACQISRECPHLARTFLGISTTTLLTLRSMALSDMCEMAQAKLIVSCSFEASPWFWRELMSASSDAYRQRLQLVSLQPRFDAMSKPIPAEPERYA